jgi:hypothetical protein
VALSNSVVSAVQGAVSTGDTLSNAASNTSSSRMQGLAGAAGALAAYNTYNQAKDILKDPGKANDISVNVSLGSSKSSASSQDKSTTAVGSQVVSAGSVNVTAKNPKSNPDGTTNTNDKTANAGHILIEGSQVIATEDINLNADRDITLLAAGNTSEHSSQNKSSSGSVGVGFNLVGPSTGVSVNASASRAKGQADGTSQSSTNTRVQAGGTLTFNSGGDTTMKGATASGNKVTGTVGGNLNLSSLQDTSQYKENSQSSGFSVSVPITGGAASASVSHSKTKIDSTYQSVGEQTAIRAGDGGFDIDVQGKTTLTGAQITSTQAAIDNNKNKFKSAGGIDMQDLQNSAQYDASSYSVSATVQGDSHNKEGTPQLDKAGQPIKGKPTGSAGYGSDSGQGSSTSTSGISGIAGDTKARTGDKETGLTPLFDAAKTKAEVQSQVAITAEFGKNASKAWGDFASNKEQELRSQGKHEEADKWREGGTYRAAGHFVIGGLGGGSAGALASGGISLAADKLNSLQDELKNKLIELGMSPDTAQMFSQGAGMATAGTLGTAAGGTVGGGSAFNTDTNNRQLTPDDRKKARDMSRKSGGKYTVEQIEDEMRRGSNTAKGETAASNMIINPEADKALGSNPTDPVASTNFDKGAVFNNTGGSVVQVDRDGSPLASKPGNPDLQAYIQANTGGADSPYKWVTPQAEVVDPNASIKMKVDPNWNYMGSNSASIPSGTAKVPDGSYGAGFYTPIGGGEVEVEFKNGEPVGAKLGLGVGAGGHVNVGTQSVGGGMLKGPVSGAKGETLSESNPQQAGEVRVGASASLNVGAGTVGLETGYAAGASVNKTGMKGYENVTITPTIAPVIPKISAEIKVNIIELSVKRPTPTQPASTSPDGDSK